MSFRVRHAPVGLLLLLAQAGLAQELTEKKLVELFLSRSPYLRELKARAAITEAETRGRTIHPNPAGIYSREGAGLAEFLEIEQPLILSGRRSYLREAGAAAVAAADLSSKQTLWMLRSDLRAAFYRLLEAQETGKIVENSVAELDEIVRILRQREEEGEGSRFDRLRVERESIELHLELAGSGVEMIQARGRVLAFFPPDAGLAALKAIGQIALPPAAPDLEALVARALSSRPDFLSEKKHAERYQNEWLAAKRLKVPDPIVSAGFKRAQGIPGIQHGFVVGLTVPIPLFNRGQTEVALAAAEYDRAQARLLVLEGQIRAEIAAARAVFELRRAAVEDYERRLELRGTQLIEIAQLAYQEGERGILELLDVYRAARQAQLRALALRAAVKQAQIELERVVGEEVIP